MIKFIFLDLDDTILDFQLGERIAIKKTLDLMSIPYDDELIERYIEINISCWKAFERGEMTPNQVYVGRFQMLFDEMKISASPEEAQRIYHIFLAQQHEFIPGAKEVLDKLYDSGMYKLYMATNGNPEVQWPRIKDSDIRGYFEDIFISYDFGVGKPKKEFFDRCFERIPGFKPEECIIVGDSLSSDIKGGINAGIKTCHFNRRGSIYTDVIPDYTITEMSQLIPLLDSIK